MHRRGTHDADGDGGGIAAGEACCFGELDRGVGGVLGAAPLWLKRLQWSPWASPAPLPTSSIEKDAMKNAAPTTSDPADAARNALAACGLPAYTVPIRPEARRPRPEKKWSACMMGETRS
eukprot:6621096-Prymnesium_polylepis.1